MNERKRLERQRERLKAETDAVDFLIKDLLDRREGRLFVWWLLSITKYGQQPFTTNALTTSFNCGELNIGQQILARFVATNPAGYIKLLEERKAEDERHSRDTAGGYDYHDPADADFDSEP